MATITSTAMRANPVNRDQWLVESLGRGGGALVGRITPAGSRRFYFRYTGGGGQQVRLSLGDFDAAGAAGLTVATARAKAGELSMLYRSGVRDVREHLVQQAQDAQDADNARRQAEAHARQQAELEAARRLTVRQLFDRWASVALTPRVRADGKRQGRKDGGEYVRAQFERHVFPTVGDMPITELRRADLMAILDAQKAAGKLRTANTLLADLKQMLKFALQRELIERNVLDVVAKADVGGADVERERTLDDGEIRTLAGAVQRAALNDRSRLAVWAILATACRVGELMNARWEHIDLDARTWTIPPEHAKNQREHVVHLSAFALDQFKALHALREVAADSEPLPWVFPDRLGRGPVCIKSFGKQLADRQRADPETRLKNRTSKTDALALPGGRWTAHDLRRTAATIMARLGFGNDVIDAALNHVIGNRVTRVYVRDRREADQARAFDALGQHLATLATLATGTEAAGNVVAIKRAA